MAEVGAIILAAGKAKRMNTERTKVLHEVCGQPMIRFVLDACREAGADRLFVVVGPGAAQVQERFAGDGDIQWVTQAEQKGTGHAVQCCKAAIGEAGGSLLIVAGDMPLVRRETLANLYETLAANGDAATIATTVLTDPTGYGRIIRDDAGAFEAIVEERDCTPKQREICEVNPSYYCFEAAALFDALKVIKPDNAVGEYYLTDAIQVLRSAGKRVSAVPGVPAEDAMGVNSRLDLATVNRAMQDRIQIGWMSDGVTIVDPDNTWIEAGAMIGRDTVVQPFSFIGSGARIGEGCVVGPHGFVAPGEALADGTAVGAAAGNQVGNAS